MTVLVEAPTTTTLLAAARTVGAAIAARAEETDSTKRVAPDLMAALGEAGLFRMLLPREFGGDELPLPVAVEVLTEVARADCSAGWQVIVGSSNQYFLGRLPEATMREAMSVPGDVLVRGALAPKGVARAVPGGYVLSGRWPLASGSYEADWVPAGFVVMEETGPRKLPTGGLDLRLAVLRPEQVTWHDTWDSIGLRGSQSQDFEVEDIFVPEEWTGSFFGASSIDSPWFALPPMPTAPLHAAVVVGGLKGMVDDLSILAPTKKPAFGGGRTLAEDAVFTTSFGELASQVDILEVANRHVAETMWRFAEADGAPDRFEYQRLASMNTRIHRSATGIADELMALAGSSSVYSSSSMQRRWRDIRTAGQHITANVSAYNNFGVFLSGGTPAGIH